MGRRRPPHILTPVKRRAYLRKRLYTTRSSPNRLLSLGP